MLKADKKRTRDDEIKQFYLIHLDDVFTVPLLGHIAQASSDVDPAADVHVHLHRFLLDFAVQI